MKRPQKARREKPSRRFDKMTIHDDRQPVLRVVPGPSDINANGHIFGGWVLSQMDIAAGIIASRRANGPVATVAIEKMEFLAPIHLRDLISVYASVERVGPGKIICN
jgi:acyl-CoA thioesterase YciA